MKIKGKYEKRKVKRPKYSFNGNLIQNKGK